jgi:hypothetical protein
MALPLIIPAQVPAESQTPYSNPNASPIWTQSPLLRPNIGVPDGAGANSGTVLRSRSDFLNSHARAQASVQGTLGGSFASGETIHVIFTCGAFPGGKIDVPYTTVTADTSATELGDHLALTVNQNKSCMAFGISAASVAGVMHFYQQGPVGNFDTVSFTTTGSETMAWLNPAGGTTGIMSGGSGPIFAFNGFSISLGGQLFVAQAGSVNYWDIGLVAVAVNEGQPVA